MAGPLFTTMLADFLFGFGTLFSLINPFGLAFIFLERTRALDDAQRRDLATRVAVYSFVVLVVSLFLGSTILGFFGISLPALRIAGGLVVAVSGWNMLNAPMGTSAPAEGNVFGPAAARAMAFFPLTVPLTTGPGTIAAAVALGANTSSTWAEYAARNLALVLVAAVVAVTIYIAYRRSESFARILGPEGTGMVTRISAFLLLCVGVQIMLTGATEALGPLIAAR